MILIRRLWLLPAVVLSAFIYYLFIHGDGSAGFLTATPKYNDGLLHWTRQKERFPVKEWIIPTRGRAPKMPRIQFAFDEHREVLGDKKIRETRQAAVKEAFVHAWEGYKQYAWRKDEVAPISGNWRNSFGGWGASMVDTMDTLLIMDLQDDFKMCLDTVAQIDFTTNTEDILNIFETTIRYLGGLISAYDMTDRKHKILLTKARELGDILITAFDTPNRMPVTRWPWQISARGGRVEASPTTLLAEIGSMSLEFTRLTQLTGENKFHDAISRITNALDEAQFNSTIPGLWPTILNAQNMAMDYNHFTFGGMADSTYEYLPKMFILTGGRTKQYQRMFEDAINMARRFMFFRPLLPGGEDVLVSGNLVADATSTPVLDPQGQHLSCFAGGMMALASKIFMKPEDLKIGRKLVEACVLQYDALPSGLMPETFHLIPCHIGVGETKPGECVWSEDKWYEAVAVRHGINATDDPIMKGKTIVTEKMLVPGFTDMGDVRYILRPEAIESLFILYRITGDTTFQDHAWRMFQAIEKATRTDIAHAAIADVRKAIPDKSDRMESFWLAETLKYFYLIFSDPKLLSLDDWVFNTEAHPLKRPPAVPVVG